MTKFLSLILLLFLLASQASAHRCANLFNKKEIGFRELIQQDFVETSWLPTEVFRKSPESAEAREALIESTRFMLASFPMLPRYDSYIKKIVEALTGLYVDGVLSVKKPQDLEILARIFSDPVVLERYSSSFHGHHDSSLVKNLLRRHNIGASDYRKQDPFRASNVFFQEMWVTLLVNGIKRGEITLPESFELSKRAEAFGLYMARTPLQAQIKTGGTVWLLGELYKRLRKPRQLENEIIGELNRLFDDPFLKMNYLQFHKEVSLQYKFSEELSRKIHDQFYVEVEKIYEKQDLKAETERSQLPPSQIEQLRNAGARFISVREFMATHDKAQKTYALGLTEGGGAYPFFCSLFNMIHYTRVYSQFRIPQIGIEYNSQFMSIITSPENRAHIVLFVPPMFTQAKYEYTYNEFTHLLSLPKELLSSVTFVFGAYPGIQ
jgi:hypothetical protein